METLGLPRIHLLHPFYVEASELTSDYLCDLSMQWDNNFAQEALLLVDVETFPWLKQR